MFIGGCDEPIHQSNWIVIGGCYVKPASKSGSDAFDRLQPFELQFEDRSCSGYESWWSRAW